MKDKQDWSKRFGKKFPNIHGRKLPLQLKSFIQSELDRQVEEITDHLQEEGLDWDYLNNLLKKRRANEIR